MDKLDAMQTFVAIVDHGSLTAAARVLGKAQPTVVRSLALLEDALGVRLLQRTTRRMSLTPEGQTYLQRCRQILGDIVEAEALLERDAAHLRGQLRITAPVLFGQLRVAPLIYSFLERAPEVDIELVLLDRVVNLVEEGFDLGVRIAELEDSSLIASRVGQVTNTCVVSPTLLARCGAPKHPRQLQQLPIVSFGRRSFRFRESSREFTVPVQPRLFTNQARSGIAACERGLGFGQFLSYQVQDALKQGTLVRILGEFERLPTPVHVVFPHARLLSARQRALLDWLEHGLGEQSKCEK